jgi:hypothetical protein
MIHNISPLTVIDIETETRGVNCYKNIPLSRFNDQVVRVGIMAEAFYWHYHPNLFDERYL